MNLAQVVTLLGTVPSTTDIFYSPGDTYERFLGANGIEPGVKTRMSYAIIVQGNFEMRPSVQAPAGTVADNVPADVSNAIMEAAAQWYYALNACVQTKPLNEDNYVNYFQSKGVDVIPWKIEKIINFQACREGKISEDPEFEILRASSTFIMYHTNATSIPSVVTRALDACPFSTDEVFTANELDLHSTAVNEPTSISAAKAIPDRMLVIASAILTASNGLPAKWHAGIKAVQAYPSSKYAALVEIMKFAMRQATNTSDITPATSLAQLRHKMDELSL